MSRYNPTHQEAVNLTFPAIDQFRTKCLLSGTGFLTEGRVWDPSIADEAYRHFVANPIDSDEKFIEKLEKQFSSSQPQVLRYLADVYWLLVIFPSNMGAPLKRQQICTVLGWAGTSSDIVSQLLSDEILAGLGSAGPGYMAHRSRELRYLLNFARLWTLLPEAERERILADAWAFGAWLEQVPDPGYRQLRHILPYLFFPDWYERIASPKEIRLILEHVGSISKSDLRRLPKLEQDRLIYGVRETLERETGHPIDFYEIDIVSRWRPSGNVSDFSPETAYDMLSASLSTLKLTAKIAAFVTVGGVPVALDRTTRDVQVWTRPLSADLKGVSVKKRYANEESRNSNLPVGLARGTEAALMSVNSAEGLEGLIEFVTHDGEALLNENEFTEMVSAFRRHMPDFTDFRAENGLYYEQERRYKDEFNKLLSDKLSVVSPMVDVASDARSILAALHEALTGKLASSGRPQNMANWRSSAHLIKLDDEVAIRAARALVNLWTGSSDPAVLLEAFAAEYVRLLEGIGETGAQGMVRTLGSLLLAAKHPSEAILIKNEVWFRAYRRLVGGDVFLAQPITADEYRRALSLAHSLFTRLEALGWQPSDLWDVHNFLWIVDQYKLAADDAGPETDDSAGSLVRPPLNIKNISELIGERGLRYDETLIARYHLSLRTRNFVILAGDSGTGKTKLAETYALVTGSEVHVEPVAPNWTANEDLLGYQSPLDGQYRHTAASRFMERAAREFENATSQGRTAVDYHLVLDEMNLARVEQYFARLLSAMERRDESGAFQLELEQGKHLRLGLNFLVVGTVNVDETTHSFADKVYDRAQLIEVEPSEELILDELFGLPYAGVVETLWRGSRSVAPFAFRTLKDIRSYVNSGADLGLGWRDCIDHQIRQKILPKAKGTSPATAAFIDLCIDVAKANDLPLTLAKASLMKTRFTTHGYASYF